MEDNALIQEKTTVQRIGSSKQYILGHNCDVLNLKVPVWYKKSEMFDFLRNEGYCKEIAEQLSKLWADDLQGSFRKGFEKGYQYATHNNIDAIVHMDTDGYATVQYRIETKMSSFISQLMTLPTWILSRGIIPFLPKSHAWYKKRFSLSNWARHSTPLNNLISISYWVYGIAAPILIYQLIHLWK